MVIEDIIIDGIPCKKIGKREEREAQLTLEKFNNVDKFIKNKEIVMPMIKGGIELEFYVKDKDVLNTAIHDIIDSFFEPFIINIGELNIKNKDYNNIYLENDLSLEDDYGVELITHKCNYTEIPYYLKKAFYIIEKNGYSNEKCGLHFHLSSNELEKIDPIKFMLFIYYENSFLKKYVERNNLSKNIIEIFKNTEPHIFSKNRDLLGKNFNIRFIDDDNHIEIRAFGGENYFKKLEETIDNLHSIVEVYYKASLSDVEEKKYSEYLERFIQENGENLKGIINIEDIVKKAKYLTNNSEYYQKLEKLLESKERSRLIDDRSLVDGVSRG